MPASPGKKGAAGGAAAPPRGLRQATLPFGGGGRGAAAAAPPPPAKKPPGGGRAGPPLRPPAGRLDLGLGATLVYLPAAIPDPDGATLAALQAEVDWLQRDVTVWGRTVPQRRLVAYMADAGASFRPYAYSGLTLTPAPWTPAVATIKKAVEAAAGCAFDTCLLNLYRGGSDAMAWHSDGEALYGPFPTTIGSASFGARRAFQLRPTPGGAADGNPAAPAARIEYGLGGGDVLVMAGTTQRDWQHCVPPRAGAGGVRVNLTFRATAGFKARERGG